MTKNKIAVIGAGTWGTVLADHLDKKGNNVVLWDFFKDHAKRVQSTRLHPHVPGFTLNPGVSVTSDIGKAVKKADLCIIALPSKHVRKIAREIGRLIPPQRIPLFVSASKGIESSTLMTMCEAIEQEIPVLKNRVMAFSGPSFATEVARGVPTKIKLAGFSKKQLEETRKILNGHPIKVEISTDRKGVEWGGAIKNVLAIGSGILDGMGAGINTKAVLLTHGMVEMGRMIKTAGGNVKTVYGLACMGDLIATGISTHSRNWSLGEKIGSGKTLTQARKEVKTVAEGLQAALSVHRICRLKRIKAPIMTAIWDIVHKGSPPAQLLKAMDFNRNGQP